MADDLSEVDDDEEEEGTWSAYVFAVWKLIIRPPRHRYTRNELWEDFPPGRLRFGAQEVVRTDFSLIGPRGFTLVCTLFEPQSSRPSSEKAVVVACHGNGTSRLNSFKYAHYLCPFNIALCCFDFAGSGMSGGNYVSLGHYEKDDLRCVIEHLRSKVHFTRVAVWGYSMGASTALLHASRDPSLAGIVADSPFSNLWQLIEEIVFNFLKMPSLVLRPFLHYVSVKIESLAGFKIADVSPLDAVPSCFSPVLFLHGDKDDFISLSHSERLKQAYAGESSLIVMPGMTHATRRSPNFLGRAALFLVRALRWEEHLPDGVTEETLKELSMGRLPHGAYPEVQRQVVLWDKQGWCEGQAIRTDVLITAACQACPAYKTARISRIAGDARLCFPALFEGHVRLETETAEIALCWAQPSSCKAGAGGQVMVALFCSTTVSLTSLNVDSVTSSEGLAVKCTVEPITLVEVELRPYRNHPVSLRLMGGGPEPIIAELQVAGSVLTASCSASKERCSKDEDVLLTTLSWVTNDSCAQLTLKGSQQDLVCATSNGAVGLQQESGKEALVKEKYAAILASACLGSRLCFPTLSDTLEPPASDALGHGAEMLQSLASMVGVQLHALKATADVARRRSNMWLQSNMA